ncbi:UNVERIFIED_CONTAM: small conductance mechanosensitive channel [Acetivibrio alkalicellulosi]
MFNFEEMLSNVRSFILDRLPNVIGAIVLIIVGLWLIKGIMRIVDSSLKKYNKDKTLYSFVNAITRFSLKLVLFFTAASVLGIPLESFMVLLGAAGLAIGFALKDNLANLSGGVIILGFRPFNVGDFIQSQGEMGTVTDIQLLYTTINTPDNRKVIIPNSDMVTSKLINFNVEKTRRVDFKFGVGYEADIKKVKEILNDISNNHPLVLEDPKPFIGLLEHGDNAIIYTVRVWCETANYWTVFYDVQEEAKLKFDENNINIPYPQLDVHMIKE